MVSNYAQLIEHEYSGSAMCLVWPYCHLVCLLVNNQILEAIHPSWLSNYHLHTSAAKYMLLEFTPLVLPFTRHNCHLVSAQRSSSVSPRCNA